MLARTHLSRLHGERLCVPKVRVDLCQRGYGAWSSSIQGYQRPRIHEIESPLSCHIRWHVHVGYVMLMMRHCCKKKQWFSAARILAARGRIIGRTSTQFNVREQQPPKKQRAQARIEQRDNSCSPPGGTASISGPAGRTANSVRRCLHISR